AKDVIRVLRRHGFRQVSQKGSHQKWRHSNGRQVIVAMHGNKPIPVGTFKSIIEGRGSARHRWENREVECAGAHESKREPNEFQSTSLHSILSSRAKEQLVRRGGRHLWSYGLAGTNEHESAL